MTTRKILTYPDPVLRQQAAPVTVFDAELERLVIDMIETMYQAPGVGLAANQIGVLLRVVVIDIARAPEAREPLVLVNPEILREEGSQVGEEGCLSVVDFSADIRRAQKVEVAALDVHGKPLSLEAEDLLARVIQHEVDHLNGILCLDRVSVLKRSLYKKRRKKQLREAEEANS